MVKEVILNERVIPVQTYKHNLENDLHNIEIDFKVTSEEYHDIAVLLYEGTFNVKVPELSLDFRGTIHQYSTSITNLYEKNQVADYHVVLREVKK
ncbi:DUF3219 family protein [Pallidibacillus pasinlerensis]|uniref:DUF3219 family protein n=1 Tax=Pallidibacillus pasinlerensis TaxID=2703818 RepID=A0ABX0A7A6_9BACI|nr:DUF3219 family protein [Pallidibacillus pasinlerensis]NCU18426.1 DUF3219 family protein [Pallidibacillus pasinlerensis]